MGPSYGSPINQLVKVSDVRFVPASIVATPSALEAFRASGDDLVRYLSGDWER
jgi:hypothetical protein